MEEASLSYSHKPYEKVEISECKKILTIPYNNDKPVSYVLQQILLTILIIVFCIFSYLIYKSKKIEQNNSTSLNAIITSLKNGSKSLKSQIIEIKNSLQKENKKQKLSLLLKKNYSSEFIKILSSLQDLKQKVQKPKTNTELGILISFLTAPRKVVGKKKLRLGNNGDGGYVLLDDFADIKIAYSLGISNMTNFDKALADKGIDVYMYDHTINRLPYKNKKFHWLKKGLGAKNTRKKNLMTLMEMLEQNGHLKEKNMLLKIDVEGSEWETFNELPEEFLKKFKYIIGEFHSFKKNILKNEKSKIILSVLNKLNKTHQVFHKHCHSTIEAFVLGEYYFCNNIELSFIKREGNKFENDYSIYPIDGLDFSDSSITNNKQMFLGMEGMFGFK